MRRKITPVLLFLCLCGSAGFAHEPTAAARSGPSAQAAAVPLNLNSATVEQLDDLPGIGPALAERIVAYRTEHGSFAQVDQLNDVKGIGDKTLEKLRAHLTLE
ncbi:MAG: helix-hairpin-helix domain-containing protein [Desulfuromonadales bacterium]|nr:helix-hairpin-helix domain-containing protein [Desulfuromonadales bacterium]